MEALYYTNPFLMNDIYCIGAYEHVTQKNPQQSKGECHAWLNGRSTAGRP